MIHAPLSILVTGSSGFIGSNLVRHLREAGHLVTGIDIREPEQPLPDGAAFHKCDIRTDRFPPGRFDAVVHLAALPGVRQSLHDPESYRRTNVDGTVRMPPSAGRPASPGSCSPHRRALEHKPPHPADVPETLASPAGRRERACLGAPDFLPGQAGFAAEKSVKRKNAPFTGFGWGWGDSITENASQIELL